MRLAEYCMPDVALWAKQHACESTYGFTYNNQTYCVKYNHDNDLVVCWGGRNLNAIWSILVDSLTFNVYSTSSNMTYDEILSTVEELYGCITLFRHMKVELTYEHI